MRTHVRTYICTYIRANIHTYIDYIHVNVRHVQTRLIVVFKLFVKVDTKWSYSAFKAKFTEGQNNAHK